MVLEISLVKWTGVMCLQMHVRGQAYLVDSFDYSTLIIRCSASEAYRRRS